VWNRCIDLSDSGVFEPFCCKHQAGCWSAESNQNPYILRSEETHFTLFKLGSVARMLKTWN
jgi:hypothetical protein